MAGMDDPSTIETRIKSQYDELPPTERRLADVILEFPGEIATFMAVELAARAGVSKAAATRLFKRLGYSDYGAVRREVIEARIAGSPVLLNRLPEARTNLSRMLDRHLNAEIAGLTRTIEGIDPLKVATVVRELSKAARICALGFRNSYFFAHYFQAELARIRPGVFMLPLPGQTLGEALEMLETDTLLVIVGLRRRPAILPKVLELASAAEVKVLYFTDHGYAQGKTNCTWTLQSRVTGTSLFDSYAPMVSIMNLICTAVAERLGDAGRKRLKRIDLLHEKLGELSTS